jgi:HD-GYP domain-containing protein (c-di-GMP phosphodiesterase class II)
MSTPKYSYDQLDFDLIELDKIIESYDVASDPVLKKIWPKIARELWQEIGNYGADVNQYGEVMHGHLERISKDGQKFMGQLGYSAKSGRNFYDAFKLSDIGKLHSDYDINIWSLPHSPTPEERRQKSMHTLRGLEYLEQAYIRHNVSDEFYNHPHIKTVIPTLMLYHHERLDGKGYSSLPAEKLGKTIRMACIVDAYDGDRILRPHQPAKRTEEEAINRMMALGDDKKYAGAFDSGLLQIFKSYKLMTTPAYKLAEKRGLEC